VASLSSLVLWVLGLVAVIYGIVVAVQAEAATPLLGVGVALIFLGFAFRGDSREIRLGMGDASISVIRDVRNALVEATTAAPNADELREQIEEIAGGLSAVEIRLAAEAASPSLRRAREGLVQNLMARARANEVVLPTEPWADATTAHEFRSDQIVLTVIYGDLDAVGLFCTVSDPAGNEHSRMVEPTLDILGTRAFSTSYPRDFPTAATLEPGPHEVGWEKVRPNGGRGEEIAADEFEVPAAPPGR
jgi:hypothetical protein